MAQAALHHWLKIKAKLNVSMAQWCLQKRYELVGLHVMWDAVSVMQQSLDNVMHILNSQVSALLCSGLTIYLILRFKLRSSSPETSPILSTETSDGSNDKCVGTKCKETATLHNLLYTISVWYALYMKQR